MAAFGWSVGDLILAIRFVVKTGQALKDTGGASDDYQESIDFLHGVEATLKNLEVVARRSPTGAAIHSIAPQAQRIQQCLKSFMESIEGYEASLGLNRKRGFHHGAWQKGKWAAFVSKRCKELQGKIAFVTASINMNLSLQLL
ncbi:hypothetical protein MMC30_001786 [Trapelia coarctata]|nr:hypothetical protein [Trapelia coarctata]